MSFIKRLGVGADATGHAEKLISAVGGFISLLLTMWVSGHSLGVQGAALLVASMGASAVLLFAVPNGALSQPWPLLGGHAISALIGVACAQGVADPLIAAPLAVALAIAAMHYLRCIHPPGGATAITAVIGGSQVHELGFQFVLTPVLLNAVLMLLAAVAVNYAFPWRRYPARLAKPPVAVKNSDNYNQLSHVDFAYALREEGSYVDISEDELAKIYRLAFKHAWQLSDQPEQISAGLYYSNGEQGADLSVRKVLSVDELPGEVTYKIVAGDGQGGVKTDTLADFTNWQRYEVIFKNGAWHRIRLNNVDSLT
ncbi:MAG: HPP family protein [Gallionella sp.]